MRIMVQTKDNIPLYISSKEGQDFFLQEFMKEEVQIIKNENLHILKDEIEEIKITMNK